LRESPEAIEIGEHKSCHTGIEVACRPVIQPGFQGFDCLTSGDVQIGPGLSLNLVWWPIKYVNSALIGFPAFNLIVTELSVRVIESFEVLFFELVFMRVGIRIPLQPEFAHSVRVFHFGIDLFFL